MEPDRARVCEQLLKMAAEKVSTARHTYKSIASGFARLSVRDDNSLLDVSEHLEVFPEAGVGGVVRQTSYEDLGERCVFLCRVHHV